MDKLQWGNRKRLRCMKVKEKDSGKSDANGVISKKRITDRRVVVNEQGKHNNLQSPNRNNRSNGNESKRMSILPLDKEDRYYTTRGSGGVVEEPSSKMLVESKKEKKKVVWPKLYTTLSSKEKEEDFMAMKGCKLPQRPKKRAKLVQRSLLLVSPGVWLSDLCQERYEVREKKTSKKRPTGLKAMGSMESDSE